MDNLALIIESGRFDEAHKCLNRVLAADHGNAAAMAMLAYAKALEGSLSTARKLSVKALDLATDDFGVLHTAAKTLDLCDDIEDAASRWQKLVQQFPKHKEGYLGLALIRENQNLEQEARLLYRKAAELAPGDDKVNLNWSRFEEATNHLEKAAMLLAQVSEQPAVLLEKRLLEAQLEFRAENYEKTLEILQSLDLAETAPGGFFCHWHFELGKAYDKLGRYKEAFVSYQKANEAKTRFQFRRHDEHHHNKRLQGINETFDDVVNNKMKERISNLKSVFTQPFVESRKKLGHEDDTAIFIIGLPRTGKTVTETLLCRHPMITAGGEQNQFYVTATKLLEDEKLGSFPDGVAALSKLHFEYVGKEYIRKLRKRFKMAQHVTNTLPSNAFQLGMIKLCLPQSKIIWIDREMRDACFDMYRKDFFAKEHEYTNDLGVLGEYSSLFNNLMEHWDQLFPGFIYKVRFEDIIADMETQMRGLLSFCNLNWDDACLEASCVEQGGLLGFTSMPSPENAIGAWKPYEKYLSPLFDALGKK